MKPDLLSPELRVPGFARLSDFLGPWAIEPSAFASGWEMIRSLDLAAHMAETPPPVLESALEKMPARNGQTVGLIRVIGPMMKGQSSFGGASTVQLRRDIRQAAADPEIGAILLAIDSPGGTVAGTDDLAQEIRTARRQKSVWAHVDDLSASASYWIASQTEAIYANSPTALVGSIGTIMTVYDVSAAAEKEGVRAMVFSTGSLKGAGVPGSKVTDEQAAYFQGIVEAAQAEFDAAVKKGRGLTSAQLADVRSGGVFAAPVAMEKRLIDGIQPLGKTIDMLAAGDRRSSREKRAAGLPALRQRLPMLTKPGQ